MVEDRLLKINDVFEDRMPMAKSTLWQRVKDGVLPQPGSISGSFDVLANTRTCKPSLVISGTSQTLSVSI